MVQRDTDKYIIDSSNDRAGEFAAYAVVDGPQQAYTDVSPLNFGPVTVYNLGIGNDSYDVSIDTSSLPDGWERASGLRG